MEHMTGLRVAREAKGQTVSGMAKALRIGVSRYHMIESGDRPATPELAERISAALGLPKDSLFLPQSFTVRKGEQINLKATLGSAG